VVKVTDSLHIFSVRAAVRAAGRAAGFTSPAVEELVIAGSELAWNALRHGGGGEVEVGVVRDPERGEGVLIEARDRGPPFRNFATALIDRNDDTGPIDPLLLARRQGIGSGLGAVSRFTHDLTYVQEPDGKRVTAVRYLVGPRKRVPR